jgi:hypothetical protein
MDKLTDAEIWHVAYVWYTRDPRLEFGKEPSLWDLLSDSERSNYYQNAKAVLLSLRRR